MLLRTAGAVRSGRGLPHWKSLAQDGLVFALGAVVAVEAAADTGRVVAQAAARAVAAGLVTITLEHVGSGGALD